VVVDTWPAGLTFTGASITPAANTLNGNGSRTLTWNFDPVAAGGDVSITVDGTIDFPPAADEVTNAVVVTGQNVIGVPQPSLNDSVVTDIQFPELEATKTATVSVNAGERITYRVTYENVGDADAAGVALIDTLPPDMYYSAALDAGAGPAPDTVTPNTDGTTTLTWFLGTVSVGSGQTVVEYTARPSLLVLGGETLSNDASLDFSDANGNDYPAVAVSASTSITTVPPTRNPMGLGFWRNHLELWSAEILARIQATDDRFDGEDGTTPDGMLSTAEVRAVLVPGGNMDKVLEEQLLGTYFNLATRRINAGTTISSRIADRLGLGTVRAAAIYAIDTLLLPVNSSTRARFSNITTVLSEINANKSEIY
jgi:uncharacterized repeat protein (TIGR01451 family)